MLVTDLPEIATRAGRLRNHGASIPEEVRHAGDAPFVMPAFDDLGFNYRMTDLQAAVGLVQLGKLDGFIVERDRWARWYIDQLQAVPWLRRRCPMGRATPGRRSYVCSRKTRRSAGLSLCARCTNGVWQPGRVLTP